MLKKISAFILVVAVLLSLGITASATQANYLVDYNGQYTYSVTYGYGGMFYLKAAPDYDTHGFANTTDATLTWSIVPGSTSSVYILDTYTEQVDSTHYVGVAKVAIAGNTPAGVASIKAEDADGAYVNFTLLVDYTTDTGSVTGVQCRFYSVSDQGVETQLISPHVSSLAPAAGTHHGDTHFTSAIDGVQAAATASASITSITITNLNNTMPYYVQSMTIGGTPYTAVSDYVHNIYTGWQYRVYRNNSIVPITEVIGADQFALQDNDVIVWKFGEYGVVTFPSTIS